MTTIMLPRYRWLIGIIMLFSLLGANVLWFAPAPLLTIIMQDLEISYMQTGFVISVVCLITAFVGFASAPFTHMLGPKKAFGLGLWLMGLGSTATYLANYYAEILFTRVMIGAGIGLCLPVTGALVMMWFSEK